MVAGVVVLILRVRAVLAVVDQAHEMRQARRVLLTLAVAGVVPVLSPHRRRAVRVAPVLCWFVTQSVLALESVLGVRRQTTARITSTRLLALELSR